MLQPIGIVPALQVAPTHHPPPPILAQPPSRPARFPLTDLAAHQAVPFAPAQPSATAARNTDGAAHPPTTAAPAATLSLAHAAAVQLLQPLLLSLFRRMARVVPRAAPPALVLPLAPVVPSTAGAVLLPATVALAATVHSVLAHKIATTLASFNFFCVSMPVDHLY